MNRPLKVGSLVFATQQGLGLLAKEFYAHGVVTDVCTVRHGSYVNHHDWYPPHTLHVDLRRPGSLQTLHAFCDTLDVLLCFETPFEWTLLDYCRAHKVRTVLMPMHECMPEVLPALPDLFLNPSLLDQQCYPHGTHLPVPVPDWTRKVYRERGPARTYLHNAGHGGLLGRNGTGPLLDALTYSTAPYKLIIHTQNPLQWDYHDPRLQVRVGDFPPEKRYGEGEAFVFPEKFNGLSLPIQEAYATGYLMLCTGRFPNTAYLPPTPLLPVHKTYTARVAGRCRPFECSELDPSDVGRSLDFWFERDGTEYSRQGRAWAETMSWEVLKPRYLELLRGL